MKTVKKHERPVIGARNNLYHKSNDGLEEVVKTVDAWKKLDEHGLDYVSENSEEEKKAKEKLRKKRAKRRKLKQSIVKTPTQPQSNLT